MIHVYRIKSAEMVDEPLEDLLENEGRSLFDVYVEHATGNYLSKTTMFEDMYEGGWPVAVQGLGDWGVCVNDYAELNYKEAQENGGGTLDEYPMNRHFFIRMFTNEAPKEGTHFVFLNQYDKRVSNEELIDLVNKCNDEETESFYTINQQNVLERIKTEENVEEE